MDQLDPTLITFTLYNNEIFPRNSYTQISIKKNPSNLTQIHIIEQFDYNMKLEIIK